LVAGGQQTTGSTRSAKAPEPITIPMELLGNRPVIRIKINEMGPFSMLVAPDAEATVIDRTLAAQLQLKPQKDSAPVQVEMDIGMSKLSNVPVTVTDVAPLLEAVGRAGRPMGLVSASIWPNQLVTLDYSRWQVAIEAGSLPEPNGRDVFALKPSGEPGLTLTVAGQTIPCRIDPLFPAGVSLPDSFAGLLPLSGKPVSVEPRNTANGTVSVREARLAGNASLGMFELTQPFVEFAGGGDTCTVGGRRLIGFSLTYDVTNGRMRLARGRIR
jgi:hypothetical protein